MYVLKKSTYTFTYIFGTFPPCFPCSLHFSPMVYNGLTHHMSANVSNFSRPQSRSRRLGFLKAARWSRDVLRKPVKMSHRVPYFPLPMTDA